MGTPIISRALIARQAEAAARAYLKDGVQPPNPYCPITEPDHHAEWKASFTRSLHALRCEEGTEACA